MIDNHDNCSMCNPEKFTVEVDMRFLKMVKDHYDILNRVRPNWYTTKQHGKEIDKKINQALEGGLDN